MKTYYFVSHSNNSTSIDLLTSSIIVSYCIRLVCDISLFKLFKLSETNHSRIYFVLLIIIGIVVGFACAKFKNCRFTNWILNILRIGKNFNENIWDDIYSLGGWFLVHQKNKDSCYLGKIKFIEENQHFPIIVLSEYETLNYKNLKPIKEKQVSNANKEYIAIATDDIDFIKIINTSHKQKTERPSDVCSTCNLAAKQGKA